MTWTFSGDASGTSTWALTSLQNVAQPGNVYWGVPWTTTGFLSDLTLLPEPVTLSVLALGGLAVLLRRRRRA